MNLLRIPLIWLDISMEMMMPRKQAVIFLAGHGSVSNRMEFVDDQSLGSYNVILPAMSRGQLCFVAHNMILQGFINSRNSDELLVKLQELENIHGVSSISISRCSRHQAVSVTLPGSCIVDLTNTAHRQDLRMLWNVCSNLFLYHIAGNLFYKY